MRLPNAAQAIVPDAKIRDYLLATGHKSGGSKARFFEALGYDCARWGELADDLLRHGGEAEVTKVELTDWGTVYVVEGPLTGPNGKSAKIRVAWIVRNGENAPRLVTSFPSGGRR